MVVPRTSLCLKPGDPSQSSPSGTDRPPAPPWDTSPQSSAYLPAAGPRLPGGVPLPLPNLQAGWLVFWGPDLSPFLPRHFEGSRLVPLQHQPGPFSSDTGPVCPTASMAMALGHLRAPGTGSRGEQPRAVLLIGQGETQSCPGCRPACPHALPAGGAPQCHPAHAPHNSPLDVYGSVALNIVTSGASITAV